MHRRATTATCGLVIAGIITTTGTANADRRSQAASAVDSGKSLAGHKWTYHRRLDANSQRDRIRFRGTSDLHHVGYGVSGHVVVKVQLRPTGKTLRKQLRLSYYESAKRPWTPWFGATDLDAQGDKEIIGGFTSGAHTQIYHAFTISGHHLRILNPPGGAKSSWWSNSSFGTGDESWKCTPNGVKSRAVYPKRKSFHHGRYGRYRVVRDSYIRDGAGWSRTNHYAATVPPGPHGGYPKGTLRYARFACPGLPH